MQFKKINGNIVLQHQYEATVGILLDHGILSMERWKIDVRVTCPEDSDVTNLQLDWFRNTLNGMVLISDQPVNLPFTNTLNVAGPLTMGYIINLLEKIFRQTILPDWASLDELNFTTL